uniref:Secreted protein n=1 Tax=Salarias fasciatus TaxID=181472 RepID=A0A672FMR3_SALFA
MIFLGRWSLIIGTVRFYCSLGAASLLPYQRSVQMQVDFRCVTRGLEGMQQPCLFLMKHDLWAACGSVKYCRALYLPSSSSLFMPESHSRCLHT